MLYCVLSTMSDVSRAQLCGAYSTSATREGGTNKTFFFVIPNNGLPHNVITNRRPSLIRHNSVCVRIHVSGAYCKTDIFYSICK